VTLTSNFIFLRQREAHSLARLWSGIKDLEENGLATEKISVYLQADPCGGQTRVRGHFRGKAPLLRLRNHSEK
jgi:hypothetical protein